MVDPLSGPIEWTQKSAVKYQSTSDSLLSFFLLQLVFHNWHRKDYYMPSFLNISTVIYKGAKKGGGGGIHRHIHTYALYVHLVIKRVFASFYALFFCFFFFLLFFISQ